MNSLGENAIYHITPRADWEAALRAGVYRASSLETDGFIHCSTGAQVLGTANLWFPGRWGLVLLEIDPEKTGAEMRFEGQPGADLFPHLYGALPPDAVRRVLLFEPDADGEFRGAGEEWSA